jgi:hypothetical protein
MRKVPAHDKWVCLACRWIAKIPLVDVRSAERPSYRCPKCRRKMLWTGTAFRPPAKGDDEGWEVVDKLLATGFLYVTTSQRRRVPRTLKELDAWIRAAESPATWLPERRVRIQPEEGRRAVYCGQSGLRDGQEVLIWHEDKWLEGRVSLRYGGKVLPSPVVKLSGPLKTIPLVAGQRLRVRASANS